MSKRAVQNHKCTALFALPVMERLITGKKFCESNRSRYLKILKYSRNLKMLSQNCVLILKSTLLLKNNYIYNENT